MTTKELIRQEIERMHQQSVIAAVGNETDWLRSRIGTLVDVMDFLDTLPDESITTCNELEEAAEKYARDEWAGYVDEDTWYLEEKTCSAFKAGAEWGAEYLKK